MPVGKLQQAINTELGGYKKFKTDFTTLALNRFGSGWAWVSVDADKKLVLQSTANQDSPFSENKTPILNLDVWEHAYYLKYQNRRPEYIEAWWQVVNWEKVNELYEAILA